MISILTQDGITHEPIATFADGTPNLDECSSANTRAALQAAHDRGDWQPYIPPEPLPEPPQPDWDAFNAAIMSDSRLNAVMGKVLGIAPAVPLGVTSALTLVATNGVAGFAPVFEALCALGGATAGDRTAWADLAAANHLPDEFIAIVRGNAE